MGERLVIVPDGASPMEMLAAWEWRQQVRALVSNGAGLVELVCPGCGGTDDVDDDGSEIAEPGTLERQHSCFACGAEWIDVYVPVSRTVLQAGRRVASTSASMRSADDFLDMAYEDANGCGVEL